VLLSLQLDWWDTETIAVTEKQDALAFAGSALAGLDPVAPPRTRPHALNEAQWAACGVAAVVLAHDLLDCFAGLVGVVKRNGGDIVVENMCLDNAVEEITTDETEFTIDCRGGTSGVCPGRGFVMRKGWVCVL
jgi:hypothetical protein